VRHSRQFLACWHEAGYEICLIEKFGEHLNSILIATAKARDELVIKQDFEKKQTG
jgi:hypothetical protein